MAPFLDMRLVLVSKNRTITAFTTYLNEYVTTEDKIFM